ncbi:MAG: helix-turn-helix domain-containing protein [Ruminococcaceae bacterium]|nr:helix-turn-helix domain-containing protein [Oscillospiraceae bacterium]
MEKRIYNGDLYDVRCAPSYKFLAVASCGIHKDSRCITVREKGREDWHLLYVESGIMYVDWHGCTVTLEAGDFIIYPPHVPHRYEQNNGVCYWTHFSGEALSEIITDAGLRRLGVQQGCGVRDGVIRIFDRMIYHYTVQHKLRELSLAADLVALLTELGKCVIGTANSADRRLRSVIVDMQKRCPQELDTSEYAAMLGISEGRFLHVFKEAVGVSPGMYIMQLRLSRAAEELLTSDRSVSDIAYEVGFRDPLYFSRRFKKQYEVSPEHFRKKQGTLSLKKRFPGTGCD